jgi:X-X-X-Leu-X-X-Gly heptad repeat protein
MLLLEAIVRGDEELPAVNGKTGEAARVLQEVFDGISAIDEGANSVAEGAETLNEGMQTLSANSESLNEGAQAIVDDILKTANEQLASSELSEAGIEIMELTEENYSDVLDNAMNEISQMITDGLMNPGDESGKKLSLTEKLSLAAKAEEGLSSLKNLKEKLDKLETFKEGLAAYTDGVDQAAAGSGELASGARSLHDEGTAKLEEKLGTSSKEVAEKILRLYDEKLEPAMTVLAEADAQTLNAGYDLRTEGRDTVTVFIIRSEL